MQPAFARLFSVEEANALIPTLRALIESVYAYRDAVREKTPDLEPILAASATNGGGKAGSEYGVEAYRLYRAIGDIQELGVLLKDLDMGLLDFPHERDGRVVFLCWHPSEDRVRFWHEIDGGYAGRQPL